MKNPGSNKPQFIDISISESRYLSKGMWSYFCTLYLPVLLTQSYQFLDVHSIISLCLLWNIVGLIDYASVKLIHVLWLFMEPVINMFLFDIAYEDLPC